MRLAVLVLLATLGCRNPPPVEAREHPAYEAPRIRPVRAQAAPEPLPPRPAEPEPGNTTREAEPEPPPPPPPPLREVPRVPGEWRLDFQEPLKTAEGVVGLGCGYWIKPTYPNDGPEVADGVLRVRATNMGLWVLGDRKDNLSRRVPEVAGANRFSIDFRMPPRMTLRDGSVVDWREDPEEYARRTGAHLAGYNHFPGRPQNNPETNNWHFYHQISQYWPDYWKPAHIRYLGDGWFRYTACDQVGQQRTGRVKLAGFYDPTRSYGIGYWESMTRFYFRLGWTEKPANNPTYGEERPVFEYDNLRLWREEPRLRIDPPDGVVRRVFPADGDPHVDVDVAITYTGAKPRAYWIARQSNDKVPDFRGNGFSIDGVKADGRRETPVFQPGETKRFTFRADLARTPVDQVSMTGLLLRVHDEEDPYDLDGAAVMFLLVRASRPELVDPASLQPGRKIQYPE